MAISGKDDTLHRARSLLANINSRKLKGNIFQDSEQAAETLCCTLNLLQSLQSSLLKETAPFAPSSSDWKALKALLELLIRMGISPHLNPGVGILRDRHQNDCSSISVDLSGLSISNPLLQSSALTPHIGMPLLFICAEALDSFFWTRSSPYVASSSSPSKCTTHATDMQTTPTTCMKALDTSLGDFGTSESPIQHSPEVPMNASSPLNITHAPMGTSLCDGTQFLPIPSTTQLVMKFFLWDLMAAYLQLSFGPCEINEDIRHHARVRLKHMVEHFPVEQMVVASFVLLNRDSPRPPPWIKAELGKQLSKLVMRVGGLVTTLEELVGRVTKGSVESYDKVAAHLANVPRSVATAEEYLEALCPQVLPLLLLKHKPRDSVLGEISLTALNNIFHTSVSLTCKIFLMEPKLATKYLVQPMMRPLLDLNSMQKSMDMVGSLSLKPAKGEYTEVLATENEVVDSLVQSSLLLTAGSSGSSAAREIFFLEARVIIPLFLKIHFQLAFNEYSSSKTTPGVIEHASNDSMNCVLEGNGVMKGFLHKGLGLSGPSEQAYEDQCNLSKLKSSLADVVMAAVNQPVEFALPCVLPFLLEHTMDVVRWPQEEGEVWEALHLEGSQSRSKATYVSRLLLMVENWPLVLALMGKVLQNILNLLKSGGTEIPGAAELLRHMQDFEELNNEAGTKALEYDTHGAASLVKDLLEDELVLCDEYMLELVLHMVHSVLKGIRASAGDDLLSSHAYGPIMTDLLSALKTVYSNASVGKKLRQMSFTLAEEVSALRKTS